MIEALGLTKEFRLFQRREGVMGAVRDLWDRDYQTVKAVDQIDLKVNRGEMVGYIGANGAGKSTTIKMLSGILVPSSGHLVVNGFVPHKERVEFCRRIGVVFGQRSQLWWDLAVSESFRLLSRVYRIPESVYRQRLDRFVELLEMADFLHIPVRKLSLGQRMRCELTAALLHHPDLVFLDEPTIGLDVLAKDRIRRFLSEINQELGTTVLLTTHDLSDIEALCSRVVMIDKGKIVYDGSLGKLQDSFGQGRTIKVDFSAPVNLAELHASFGHLPVRWETPESRRAIATFSAKEVAPAEVMKILIDQYPVLDIAIDATKIEEIVKEIYQGSVMV
ncbi:ATP-binding cassette domain-containing protein [Heliobacterium chlorum]|uniref:ATP-binding cassette domain-containing protein n=1 Tax=Heliobacterium chlorum TaxID=2698 RepID=A0ABR7T3F9_HELCL|nr:ATP-binding cassette domain-containing protein [Heliobacterium chlorum]MBC9784086.1 ATP-binding cassette domain-containing protein [Heliobacterium chlorum]